MKKINPNAGDFGYDLFNAIEAVLHKYTTGDDDTIESVADDMANGAIEALVTAQDLLS